MNPSNISPPNPASSGMPRNEPGPSGSSGSSQFKDTARQKGQQATEAARHTADELKGRANEAASHLKNRALEAVQERRRQMAERIGGYSSAIRQSASSLENEDPNIAWLTSQAADRLEGIASYVRDRSVDELRNDVESFTRRHPGVVLGGLFITGLLLGSAFRAGRSVTETDGSGDTGEDRYEPDNYVAESPVVSTTVPPVSEI